METPAEKTASPEETLFDPTYHHHNSVTHYRHLLTGPGLFRCSKTDMMFETTKEADVYYRAVNWDERRAQSTGKTPAGVFFKIDCLQDEAVARLHLPHALISVGDAELSVAQVTDEGITILRPAEVTDTHAVVAVDSLATFGLVTGCEFDRAVRGQVLMYLKPPQGRSIMNVYLLPANVPATEVEGHHEGDVHIKKPNNSHCLLTGFKPYRLVCSPHKRNPECATGYLDYGPNFHPTYRVYVEKDEDTVVTLELLTDGGKSVWKQEGVDISDYRPEGVPSQPKV